MIKFIDNKTIKWGLLRFINSNTKHVLPMQNFTQEEFQPSPSAILFIKQYARMCNANKKKNNGYTGIPVVACC